MVVPEPYRARLSALRKELADRELGGLFVSRPESRRYLSGYTPQDPQLDESSGYLFITPRRQYLLTDSRYKIQAEREALGFEVEIYQYKMADTLADLVKQNGLSQVGFEEAYLTVAAHRVISAEIKCEFSPLTGVVEKLRVCKDENEIQAIVEALDITEKALERTRAYLSPGKTELEVADFFEASVKELGADGPAFETIVASGPNAAEPHAVPSKKEIRKGETIIIDCGTILNGYRSDMTRTFVLGAPENWIREIYRTVRQAQLAAVDILGPGLMTDRADTAARSIIETAGYGPYFGHGLGHGVGLAAHELPHLSRFRATALKPGMVVTVEPGIYLEGRGGVRLEDMAVITDDGVRILNQDRSFYDW